MAYIQFLSEQLRSKKEIYIDIMLGVYNICDIESIHCHYNKSFEFVKKYHSSSGEKVEERISLLEYDVDTYIEYLKYPDIENPCVVLNAVPGKRLISLFSADKVRCGRILFEFTVEYLKLHPDHYLLVDQHDLYDQKRLAKEGQWRRQW